MPQEPNDAPFGPIARWFARRARHALIGDQMHTGGVLGCEMPSPCLEGWIQRAGFDSYVLSRYAEGATQWAVAEPKDLRRETKLREGAPYRPILAPLMRELDKIKPHNAGIGWFCRQASVALNGSDNSWDVDEDVAAEADRIRPDLPKKKWTARTLRDWYIGMTLDQMLYADDE